jgi:hypothetical protein
MEYVEICASDGAVIPFQVDGSNGFDGPVPASRFRDSLKKGTEATLEGGMHIVRAIASAITREADSLDRPPSKVSAEVGLTVTSSATVVVATSSAQAHIKIALEWDNKEMPKA